jgi:hypothetical protein
MKIKKLMRRNVERRYRTYTFVNERYNKPPSPKLPIKIVNPLTNRYVNIDGKIGLE